MCRWETGQGSCAARWIGGACGRLWRVLGLGILLLGFASAGFVANAVPPGKTFYYGGGMYDFSVDSFGAATASFWKWNGVSAANEWNGPWNISALGNFTACVFNGLIYGFFVGQDVGYTSLYYVTVDPVTHATTGPTFVDGDLGGDYNHGVAAVVSAGQIFVFVSSQFGGLGVTSSDGQNYHGFDYKCANGLKDFAVLDAITFEPAGSDPESAMLVYYDPDTSPATLRASVFSLEGAGDDFTSTQDFTLPWPSATPAWQPVAQGTLLLGTNGGFHGTAAGAKAPCLQFYASTVPTGDDGDINSGRWEYNVAHESWTFTDITFNHSGQFAQSMAALPWFDTVDSDSGLMQMSHIVVYLAGFSALGYAAPSDWMVPQNNDPAYGWQGTPTPTAEAPVGSQLRQLWTLVGIVLGPPPFAMNDDTDACTGMTDPRAWVSYGQGTSATVTTTSTMSNKVTAGVGDTVKSGVAGGWNQSLDFSYAHAWTSSHGDSKTTSVSTNYSFSPCNEPVGGQGTHGWAIFNAPTFVTQWYKLYAYDYGPSSGSGTYLDQDVYATSYGSPTLQFAYFELADPSAGEYPGLFAGIPRYPDSTDIAGWHLNTPDWDSGGSDWAAVFGDVSAPPVNVLALGGRDEETYTTSETTMSSHGNSNSISLSASVGYTWPIAGYKASVSVSAGYDREWSTTTENDTTVTNSVTMGLNVPIPPDTPGYVNSLTVQPFWLSAETSRAPWIPTGYGGNLPWCITWGVPSYSTYTASGVSMAGFAAAPASASGTIHRGGDNEKDSYKLIGAPMVWLNADGSETQLPMTADQFDPTQGAAVSLNGHAFPADGTKGKWSRKGDVWKYKTREGVRTDPFGLDLDFAAKTWSFNGSSKTLGQEIKLADDSLRVRLHLQGKHSFSTWIKHEVTAAWSHSEKKSEWQPYGVHEIKGDYDSRKGEGRLVVKGHLPKKEKHFGDVQIVVNGASVRFPLLAMEDFRKKLDHGGAVSYKADGLLFEIDFSAGKWKATIEGNQFKSDMAPKNGGQSVKVQVGGAPLSDQSFQIQKHTTELRFAG